MHTRIIIAYLLMLALALGTSITAWPAPLVAQDAGDNDDDDDDDEDEDGDDDGNSDDPDGDDPDGDDPDGDDPDGDDPGSDGDDDGDEGIGEDDPGGDEDDPGGDEGDDGGAGDDDDNGPGGDDDDDGPGGGDDDGGNGGAGDDDDDGPGGDDDDGGNGGAGDDDDDGPGGDDDDGGNGGAGGGDDDDGPGGGDDDGGTDDGERGNDDITEDRGESDDEGPGDLDDDPGQWLVASGETEAQRAANDARDRIDTDDDGFRYRRSEFVALDLSPADVAELKAGGFSVIATEKLTAIGGTVMLLRGPAQFSDEAALDTLETVADPDTIGYNHLFDSSAVQTKRGKAGSIRQRAACGCQIGLIDTGVATGLAYFKHVALSQRAFNAKGVEARLHGTAVAHLMAGTKADPAAQTRIFVADIFAGPRETAGSSYALIKALDWLAVQGVPVINISLSGPRNAAVAGAIARITKRGHVIVAAAGNDGPAAPPVFPGAYDNVVGVTAVDAENRVYRYANRGAHVDFAARGVGVPAIDTKGDVRDATGTSFAAPLVAARLARQLAKPDAAAAQKAVRALEAEARDLGPRGRDPIYGAGLIEAQP